MKKALISMLVLAGLAGCASVEEENNNIQEDVIEENQTKDLFYNAFVGNIMEKEGKNNNAITYYENILQAQYDQNYFNKLIELYLYKNDFISARNLIKNANVEKIKSNHPNLEMIYYLSNEQGEEAIKLFDANIKNILDNNPTPIFTISQYYNDLIKLNIFFFQDNEKEEDLFLSKLKEHNISQYNLLKNYQNEMKTKEYVHYAFEDFKGLELTIAKVKTFVVSKDIAFFEDIIRDENLNEFEINELVNLLYTDLNSHGDYETALELINKAERFGIVKSSQTTFNQFVSYFGTFENNDALYTLDLVKEDINKDYYFYYKAISNYRLGYKKAAKKYMIHVESEKLIKQDVFVYIDIMGAKEIFFNDNFNNLTDMNKNLLMLQYYIKKDNKKEASFYLGAMEEVANETGENEDYAILLKEAQYSFSGKFDLEKAVSLTREQYEEDPTVNSANSYLYALISSNFYNEEIANKIFDIFSEDLVDNPAYLDTKAMFLLKQNKAKEALNIYKDNKLMYLVDVEVQENISKVYKALNNKKEADKHANFAESIFNH